MKTIPIYSFIIIILFTALLPAQTTREEFFSTVNYAGGLYCPYRHDHPVSTPAPRGYAPFYISHYGRHGSRWIIYPMYHDIPVKILGDADKAGALTPLGKSLFGRMKLIAEDAQNRYGDLAPLGVQEQRGIAERMMRTFPEIFSTKGGRACIIRSRSTQVPRCILSMAAFDERLKELNPELQITREATRRDTYMNTEANTNKDTIKIIVSNFLEKHFHPVRFIASVFSDAAYAREHIKDPAYFATLVFGAAVNMFNIDYLHLSILDVFTREEQFILWQASNLKMYDEVGPSPVNGRSELKSILPLLQNILDCADSAVAKTHVSADIRFGHDTYIIPLLAVLDIEGMNAIEPDPDSVYTAWCDFKSAPMGSNLQLIFYRNQKEGDILVKFLLCEQEVHIPVATDRAPYYHWNDVRAYYKKKISGYHGR